MVHSNEGQVFGVLCVGDSRSRQRFQQRSLRAQQENRAFWVGLGSVWVGLFGLGCVRLGWVESAGRPTEPRISPCWTRAKTRDSPLELALALSEPQPKSVAPAPSSGLAAGSPSRFPPARRAWPVPSAATKGAISHDGGAVIPCDHEDLLAAPRSSRRVAAGRPGPPQPGARMDESSTLPSSQRAPSSQRSLVKDVSHPSNAAPPGAGLAWHRASDPRSAASSRQDERRILRYSRRFSSRRRSQWK